MAVYVPNPDSPIPAADVIDDLGAFLAGVYMDAEQRMLEQAARHAYRVVALEQGLGDLDGARRQRRLYDLAMERMRALSNLGQTAQEVVKDLREQNLAEWILDVAATEGEAAAASRLKGTRYAATAVSSSAADAVGALSLSLSSRLEALEQRILRYPQDVYQQTIAETAPFRLLGVDTGLINQQRAVQRFLDQGIDGFVDVSGRRWTIGAYSEMAGRTAAARAWNDAGVARMQSSGLNLVTIQGGFDACRKCAPWIGRILSTDGFTGTAVYGHATRDEAVTVMVTGTVDQARAAGWNHPNCRDKITAYLPGLSVPQEGFEYNPDAEAEREKQRALEREVRASKRRQATAPDDLSRAKAAREVRDAQADLREFTKKTGRKRLAYREHLAFADGRGT